MFLLYNFLFLYGTQEGQVNYSTKVNKVIAQEVALHDQFKLLDEVFFSLLI